MPQTSAPQLSIKVKHQNSAPALPWLFPGSALARPWISPELGPAGPQIGPTLALAWLWLGHGLAQTRPWFGLGLVSGGSCLGHGSALSCPLLGIGSAPVPDRPRSTRLGPGKDSGLAQVLARALAVTKKYIISYLHKFDIEQHGSKFLSDDKKYFS